MTPTDGSAYARPCDSDPVLPPPLFGRVVREEKSDQYAVFLVEDDIDDRIQLLEALKDSPHVHDVRCFNDSDSLIDHFFTEDYYFSSFVSNVPVLVLLDIHLPGMNGLDALRKMKSHPLTGEVRVIVMTGDHSPESILQAAKLGADGYLIKPGRIDQIHDILQGTGL